MYYKYFAPNGAALRTGSQKVRCARPERAIQLFLAAGSLSTHFIQRNEKFMRSLPPPFDGNSHLWLRFAPSRIRLPRWR